MSLEYPQFYFEKHGNVGGVEQNNVDESGKTDTISFNQNNTNMTFNYLDAALVPKQTMKIGGTVFLDENEDGFWNEGEPLLEGIAVYACRLAESGETADFIIGGQEFVVYTGNETGSNGTYTLPVGAEDDYDIWIDAGASYDYSGEVIPGQKQYIANRVDENGLSDRIKFHYIPAKPEQVTDAVDVGLMTALGDLDITLAQFGTSGSGVVYLSDAVFKLLDSEGSLIKENITTDSGCNSE